MTHEKTARPARNGGLRPDRRTLLQVSSLGLGLLAAPLSRIAEAATPASSAQLPEAWARLRNQEKIDIGIIIYPGMDQIDFTGPFEVLVRVPGAHIHVVGTQATPFRDDKGLILTPEMALAGMPDMDLLVVPGGPGQEAQMRNEAFFSALRRHLDMGKPIFSVCTGALLLGAAGLLKGRRATTHWSAMEILPYFGAEPVTERVVLDDNIVSAAGVTAGIDGALRVAAMLRGDKAAETIQLGIQYQPEPPFNAGSPETAPSGVLAQL
jgi:cyclohexyl-isocyanide hydratase